MWMCSSALGAARSRDSRCGREMWAKSMGRVMAVVLSGWCDFKRWRGAAGDGCRRSPIVHRFLHNAPPQNPLLELPPACRHAPQPPTPTVPFPLQALFLNFDLMHGVAGLLVGAIVGVTGVGGGALMTPILVMLFGVAPTTAVGTDLLYASITKTFGTAVHHQAGTVDWQVVRRLALGSLPAAALTLAWMHFWHVGQLRSGVITFTLGIALVVTALGILFKEPIHALG